MQCVCRLSLPALQGLVLTQASIAAEQANWLAQGSWPLLDCPTVWREPLAKVERHGILNANARQYYYWCPLGSLYSGYQTSELAMAFG